MKNHLPKFLRVLILFIFLILLIVFGVLFYAFKIEPYLLRTKQYTLNADFTKPLKIVQVSDIQISKHFTIENLKKVINKINEQEADIVLFTGDLYEIYAEYHDDEALIAELSKIESRLGKYAIWGNRDYGGGAVRQYEDIMEKSGIYLLRNEAVSITVAGEEHLFLAGLDDALLGAPDITEIMEKFTDHRYLYSILMTHEPDTADLYSKLGFDLIVAGHSHGGQVNIPLLPQIKTTLAEKYVDGFYSLNDQTSLYVNSGIGTSRFPMRLGVIPEITVFSLERET